jgi:hypothetical protein
LVIYKLTSINLYINSYCSKKTVFQNKGEGTVAALEAKFVPCRGKKWVRTHLENKDRAEE